MYCKISNIRCTKSQNLNDSHLILKSSLVNPLKPSVKSRMKMLLEQRRQAMLQLHLSDRQFNCLQMCALYYRLDGSSNKSWLKYVTWGLIDYNSALVQVMDWCLTSSNLDLNASIFIQENAFENIVRKMAAILFNPQCVILSQAVYRNRNRYVSYFPRDDTYHLYMREMERSSSCIEIHVTTCWRI